MDENHDKIKLAQRDLCRGVRDMPLDPGVLIQLYKMAKSGMFTAAILSQLEELVKGAMGVKPQVTEDHKLLLWVKVRELTWKESASAQRAHGKGKEAAFCDGMAVAFHKVWQQMLFPDCSLRDATLWPQAAAEAEKQWKQKAEEELRKKGKGL